MIKQIRSFLKACCPKWLRQEHGSFTLESAVVFPLLFAVILLFVVFGMYLYQKVVLYYAASVTAERAAFSWDNSSRNSRNGMLLEYNYDGLYSNLGSDSVFRNLLGWDEDTTLAFKELPGQSDTGEDSGQGTLSQRKISQSANWFAEAGLFYEGRISYMSGGLRQWVEVKLKEPIAFISPQMDGDSKIPRAAASASIVDPVEFIRSVDLLRYYTSRFSGNSDKGGLSKSQAGEVLAPYGEVGQNDPEGRQ